MFTTKFIQHDLKTLRMLNCKVIFDISNGLAMVRQQIYGEKNVNRKCVITFKYMTDFDQTTAVCSLKESDHTVCEYNS